MGRKKIAIARIQDERNRQITFSKRKAGLLKKAYELSILCDVEIAVIMITGNSKLYQYASTNMNSILIRYTEFKDPDESKTNADILEDITKKEKGASAHDDSGEEEDSSSFLLTPRTQAHYRRIDEEFDQILRHQQLTAMPAAPLSAPTPSVPLAMPVRVPVTHSPSTIHQQIQQHLQQQLEQRSSGSLTSASSGSSLLSPPSATPSDQSTASPSSLLRGQGQKSPGNMPPPINTPTRLQTLRNQTLKLHLPGSGRNYIPLGPGASPGKKAGGGNESEGEEEEETGGGAGGKPHLRVVIPGQKEFVPRTQSTSPLPQVAFNATPTSTPASQASTTLESLTTPVGLSLRTPNLFSSLPPLFSSFAGEFPFGASAGGSGAGVGGGGGGGGTGDSTSALVAFPVSIQPSAVSGSSSAAGNIILQAQNMGQPFLLTPSYDLGRATGTASAAAAAATTNPLLTSQSYVPPTSLAGISPGQRPDLEQLKLQYDQLQQQLFQQQLLLQHHHQQQQQLQQQAGGSGGGGGGGGGGRGGAGSQTGRGASQSQSQETDSEGTEGVSQDQELAPRAQFINASDVLITSQSGTATLPAGGIDSRPSSSKRPRIDS